MTPQLGTVSSPVLRGAIGNAIGGAGVGFVVGTAGAAVNGATGGDAVRAGLGGAAFGASMGFMTGGVQGYINAVQNGINPWTGKARYSPENIPTYVSPVSLKPLEITNNELKKVNVNIDGDFAQALTEWNNIARQYGEAPYVTTPGMPFRPTGFKKTLPNGTKVSAAFYQGGNTNPGGYNIKVNQTAPPPTESNPFYFAPKIYLRYQKLP